RRGDLFRTFRERTWSRPVIGASGRRTVPLRSAGRARTAPRAVIDLHSHTTASDGTDAPTRLVELARQAGVEALAVTDHDAFAGYDGAGPAAKAQGLEVICGVELSCKFDGRSPHLLAYFPIAPANDAFRQWLAAILESRRERNRTMIARLQKQGVNITLE